MLPPEILPQCNDLKSLPKTLSPAEGKRLKRACKAYPEGIKNFADAVYRIRNDWKGQVNDAQNSSTVQQLNRIVAGERPLSEDFLSDYASVLKLAPDQLFERIIGLEDNVSIPRSLIPWIVDEGVVSHFRKVFHHYHLARFDTDNFVWVYTPIDFTTPQVGFLYAKNPFGLQGEYSNSVFGYLFPQMLIIIMKGEEETERLPSTHIYYNFRTAPFGAHGNFGVVFSENPDGTKGIAGSLLFGEPVSGTTSPGPQERELSEKLSEIWRLKDGARANRILHLFGHKYARSDNDRIRLNQIFAELKKGASKPNG